MKADDVFAFILNLVGYRKKDITTNLRNSFPEISGKEIAEIQHPICQNLADVFVET